MKRVTLVSLLLALSVLTGGCGQDKQQPAPEVQQPVPQETHLTMKDYGPRETKAGQGFNVQPDGVSAFWVNTDNATPATVVVVNGTVLRSTVQVDGKLVTAAAPKSIFEKAGEYPIYLLDQKTKEKSNEMKFVVK